MSINPMTGALSRKPKGQLAQLVDGLADGLDSTLAATIEAATRKEKPSCPQSRSLDEALANMTALATRLSIREAATASQQRIRAAERLLRRLRGRGIQITLDGERIMAGPRPLLDSESETAIREYRSELMAQLKQT